MPGVTKRGKGSTRKVAMARAAVNRAASVLRARGGMSTGSYGPPANRGFYGSYSLRGRAELKFVDTTSQNVALTTTWAGVLVNGIAQGSDFNQRIGRKSTMKSVLFNGNCFNISGASLVSINGAYCRFVIIYDTQPNSGTIPTGTDIFVANDPNTALNLNNRDRFQVLMDVRKQVSAFTFSAATALTAGNPANSYWKKFKKCNKETVFSGTAATLGSISTGAIYLFVIADAASSAAIDYYIRVRFTDM